MSPPEPRQRHPAVPHAVYLRLRGDAARYEKGLAGRVAAGNDWLATHLAVVFGIAWTIWVFFIVPLVAYFLPQGIQNHIFFFSSGWIQLFALPLMVYVGNRLQRSSDAQSEAQHQAQTHIATVSDQVADLLSLQTPGGLAEVLKEVRGSRDDTRAMIAALTALLKTSPGGSPESPGPAAEPAPKPKSGTEGTGGRA